MKKIVVIGGGTGTMAVLSGLKKYRDFDISVIVSMTDDGGSNAVIRDEFGLLPLSDLRKSIIALAETDNVLLRQLFTYRFDKGEGISGHTLGNLMMAALAQITGGENKAVEAACRLFKVRGAVLPVTLEKTYLVATYDDGEKVRGEHLIDEPEKHSQRHIKKLIVEPAVAANPVALKAIAAANFIIIGPGDLYTSTFANIVVPGVAKAIQKSAGEIIFINNLMTKKGQTNNFTASMMVDEFARYVGRLPDLVLQHNKQPSKKVVAWYAFHGEEPIVDDLGKEQPYGIMRADLIANKTVATVPGDGLVRSFIRHDAKKLGAVLRKIIK